MENKIFNNNLFQKVKDLKLPIGEYALFGSAPLGIRGLRNCRDIDIIVTERLWRECCKEKNWEMKKMPHGSEYLWSGEIEIWKDWYPGKWDMQKLIDEAEIIDGLPFVKLEYVIETKKRSGRDKDLEDIEMIKNFLRNE